jgi:methionyl aminopeptidase
MVGRNDPCPCGSGFKFKKCCGGAQAPMARAIVAPALRRPAGITIKTAEEVEGLRASGRLAARILAEACRRVAPGVRTREIDRWVHEMTLEAGAYPAPLNYPHPPTDPRSPRIARGGFPASVCTSVNDVVCHGIPDDTPLAEGDIVNIDVTCILDGFFGDTSRTVMVGQVSDEARLLSATAQECMELGIARVRAGALYWEIGDAIQTLAESRGFSVVRDFTGHGIGRRFHEPPHVLHYRDPTMRFPMQAGTCFTIEPMINAGRHHTVISKEDGWAARTLDGSLSAQFEHTVLVTGAGHEVLTAAPAET